MIEIMNPLKKTLYYVQDVLCPYCYITDTLLHLDQLENFNAVPIPTKMIPKGMEQSDFFMEKDSEIVKRFIPSYKKPVFKGKVYESETASIVSYGLPEKVRYPFLKEVRKAVFEEGKEPGDFEVLHNAIKTVYEREGLKTPSIEEVYSMVNENTRNSYEHSLQVLQNGQFNGVPMFLIKEMQYVKLMGFKPNLKDILAWLEETKVPENVVII
jgi:protein-disulfide isomerase-like protein with CxxC motif